MAPASAPSTRSPPAATKESVPSDSRKMRGTAAASAPTKRPRSAQNSARRRRTSCMTCRTSRSRTFGSGITDSSLCGSLRIDPGDPGGLADERVLAGDAQRLGGFDELADEGVGVHTLRLAFEVED